MRKVVLIILVAMVAFVSSNAQVSGYLGKRFYVKYDQGFNVVNYIDPARTVAPYFAMKPSLHFVVNNHSTVGLSYSYSLVNYNNREYFTDDVPSYYTNSSSYRSHQIAFERHVFSKRRKALAPIGNYFKYGVGVQFTSIKDYFNDYDNRVRLPNGTIIYPYQEVNVVALYAFCGWGRQYVFFNRMLLNVDAQLGMPLVSGYLRRKTSAEGFAVLQNLRYSIFTVNIGIGVLLF